ncbi:extracellular serine/threonine protein kinase four-jointed [Ochlerotatus camptorhynchus]|uniref:extracellular serine/threonine protein kinase four-jointed n=1 Tax=Ochlerotatus camptorhynchus TaxID=644619 RepID=UPI0031E23FE9
MFDVRTVEAGGSCDQDRDSDTMSITARRRRAFQRQACLLSVMAAFSLGLALGVFVPLIGMSQAVTKGSSDVGSSSGGHGASIDGDESGPSPLGRFEHLPHKLPHFPTIDDLRGKDSYNSVSFIAEEKLKAEDVFRHAFHIDQRDDKDTMIIKKFDPEDRYIKEYTVRRTADGLFHKGPEKKLSQPSIIEQILSSGKPEDGNPDEPVIDIVSQNYDDHEDSEDADGVILNDIYWGSSVENALPQGFGKRQSDSWTRYLQNAEVDHLEVGCGRMQNRMVVFRDGTRACARYRQNTDQIQGELFSFYLGQLLNITNLAPSAASIIDMETKLWSSVTDDISNSQWKSTKPVVITKWIGNLEPAGIPKPFQPLERHLNKLDIKNITEGLDLPKPTKTLLDHLGATQPPELQPIRPPGAPIGDSVLKRLVELAQWSDLIVFDYLIANLDRVVNNLYNFQWNADIMAAPAHNLARQSESQLLVFLDNESGLLHGYRLLKKYEAYHGLLLDNLCVFRRSTIAALQHLRDNNVGRRLNELFERTTTAKIRDVLPPLPEKSIKILVDRIDRVLGQVQKCREIFSNR